MSALSAHAAGVGKRGGHMDAALLLLLQLLWLLLLLLLPVVVAEEAEVVDDMLRAEGGVARQV